MRCPVCKGKGTLPFPHQTFDGEVVERPVCPRCGGDGKLGPDGEPIPKKEQKAA